MWCKTCSLETNDKVCPICGTTTCEDIPTEVYWCATCNVPIIQQVNQADKGICPRCGGVITYLTTDIRPVFPEERLLMEILLHKTPHVWRDASVWVSTNRYYVNGKVVRVPSSLFQVLDVTPYITQLAQHAHDNSYEAFEKYIAIFVEANRSRLNALVAEAHEFIKQVAAKFAQENIVLSFSGGKDSTVTADLAIKALSDPSLVHIFGNTTLEFPYTIEYANRYRRNNPQAIFKTAKNNDQVFLKVCEDIGPPARLLRWCCSMFKTGPITRVINSLYRNQQILTFYGVRKFESLSRSKYNRVEDNAESVKIMQQTVATPIFFWHDIDIWLYIFAEHLDFNEAYRLGYDRVGCWCCPNNNQRAQFLSRIYMPEQSKQWRDFLISFAHKVGKPDPEEYVDSGAWKARQGGNGLAVAGDVKIRFTNCTAEDHAKIYQLLRPLDDEFLNLLTPFGTLAPELGQKLLQEVIILDARTKLPILSVQPFTTADYDYAVKIKTLNVANHKALQSMVSYQVRKFNACRKCLKCESLCKAGAISITSDGYHIDPHKCIHCKMCVTAKFIVGGCLMDRYLRTKD